MRTIEIGCSKNQFTNQVEILWLTVTNNYHHLNLTSFYIGYKFFFVHILVAYKECFCWLIESSVYLPKCVSDVLLDTADIYSTDIYDIAMS